MLDFLENQGSLEAFLKEHVKHYDPATDDYERPPFAADIKEGKNDPIYNAHSYHTKVPPRSIIPYILHYTKPGDLILDPFCGSGMTGVAAQMCVNPPADILEQFPELKDRVGARACILNDLSPAACHIAYNYNTPVDVEALRQEFKRIKAEVKEEFDWLYGTEHYEPAIGDYALTNPEVLVRLKNPPELLQGSAFPASLLDEEIEVPKTWILLSRVEVERRLGYPVSDLPRDQAWKDIDVSSVEEWIYIPATIQCTIWSDVYRCEGFVTIDEPTSRISKRGKNIGKPIVQKRRVARGCHGDIVLWNVAVDPITREMKEVLCCPHCNQQWKKYQLTRECDIPVFTYVEFEGFSRARKAVNFRRGRCITQVEKKHLLDIEKKELKHFFPDAAIDAGREMMRHGLLARGLTQERNFYSPRLLHALSAIWHEIQGANNDRVRRALQFAFTAILHRCSRLNRLRPSGAGDPLTGTLYIGSLWRENHVLSDFIDRQDILAKVVSNINNGTASVVNGSATSLRKISDNSIDYIFTDPPFGSNLFYADCSMLWESWLGEYTDERIEMVVSDRRIDGPFKTLDDYAKMMSEAIQEMYRVLKPGRWATIEFNNSDGRVFEAIKRAVQQAGFLIVNMLLLDKAQKSFKQTKGATGGEDVVDKDVLFNLHKPSSIRSETHSEDNELAPQVADAVRQHLQTLPDRIKTDPSRYSDDHRTTATINSMLMNTLIPRGISVERLNLPYIERVCSRYFRKIGQRWYLRGEAVTNGNGNGLILEEITIQDEVSAIEWLRQKIQTSPMLVGELKPLWMKGTGLLPAEVSQQLDLETLLRENFWKDVESNRWREPTEAEREQMNDSQTLRVLHDAERYLAGSLRRPVSDGDRCEWIEIVFKACRAVEEQEGEELPALRDFDPLAGYRMISQLFQRVMRDHVTPVVFGRAEKQERVAASKLRESATPEKGRKKGQEDKDQLELEL